MTGRSLNLVDDCGAWGDGARDDTPAFQRAAQALKDRGGGRLDIPGGAYLTEYVELYPEGSQNLSFLLEGSAGEDSTILLVPSTRNGLVIGNGVGPVRRSRINNLTLAFAGTPDSGCLMEIRKSNGIILDNVRFANFKNALQIGNPADWPPGTPLHTTLRDVKMDPGVDGGTIVVVNRAAGLVFDNVDISGMAHSVGLLFNNESEIIDTITASNLIIKDCWTALRAGAGSVYNVQLVNFRMDGCQGSTLQLEPAAGKHLISWQIANGWHAVKHDQWGIILDAQAPSALIERFTAVNFDYVTNGGQRPLTGLGNIVNSSINGMPIVGA